MEESKAVVEHTLRRSVYSKYRIQKVKLSAKYNRKAINDMFLDLVRRIHDDPEVKAFNQAEQLEPDTSKNEQKKKTHFAARTCCGGGLPEEEEVRLAFDLIGAC